MSEQEKLVLLYIDNFSCLLKRLELVSAVVHREMWEGNPSFAERMVLTLDNN